MRRIYPQVSPVIPIVFPYLVIRPTVPIWDVLYHTSSVDRTRYGQYIVQSSQYVRYGPVYENTGQAIKGHSRGSGVA
jgi:hypothetical protein